MAAKSKSWLQALTERERVFGVVYEVGGEKTVLEAPRVKGFLSDQGGLFWVCEHKDGVFKLQASSLYKYHEIKTPPSKGTAVTVTQHGVY